MTRRDGATPARHVVLSRGRIAGALGAVSALLACASIPSYLVRYYRPDHPFEPVFRRFSGELSVPAWYSALLLATSSLLLATIFLALSLDEIVGIHEMSMRPMNRLVEPRGVFRFSWVILGALFVASIGLLYTPFLRSLPDRWSTRFIAAGIVFVGGAIGLEVVAGVYLDVRYEGDRRDAVFALISATEELCEMVGSTLFINALLGYIGEQIGSVRLVIDVADAGRSPPAR